MIAARLLRPALLIAAALFVAAGAQAQPATYYAGVVQHQPASIPATQVVARFTIPRMSGGVNDFSGIATRDGVNIVMVSDYGYLVQARLQRGYGQGIAGMRERAKIYAGTVYAGRAGNRGWLVHAELNCNGENATDTENATEPRGNNVRERTGTRPAGG